MISLTVSIGFVALGVISWMHATMGSSGDPTAFERDEFQRNMFDTNNEE